MVKWFRSILLLGLVLVFSTLLSTAQEDGGELVDGEEIEIEVDGEDELVFTYNGTAGDVITIVVDAQDDTDTRMTLSNEDGDEIATDDDSGAGLNPALVRVQLPDDGEYTITIEHYSGDEELDDEFAVTLFEVELLDLSQGPQTVVLGGDFESERMVFEAEADVVYIILVTAEDDYDSTLYIEVLEEEDLFASTRVNVTGTLTAGVKFEASDDGIVTLDFDYYGFSGEAEFTIEVQVDE